MDKALLGEVQKHFPAIHQASNDFLRRLSMQGLEHALALAASCAGLLLLKQSPADLSAIPPGTAALGAVPEELFNSVAAFVTTYAGMSGVDPKTMNLHGLTEEAKRYLPETSSYVRPLIEVSDANKVDEKLRPFVAAATAVKLVLAGKQMNALDPGIGLAMVAYHLTAGSKTVPFPPSEAPAAQ